MRVGIIGGIARVKPYGVQTSVRRHRKGAKPVPLIRKAVIINPVGRTEGLSIVGAAHKHHVGCASPGRLDAGQHINIVVSGTA